MNLDQHFVGKYINAALLQSWPYGFPVQLHIANVTVQQRQPDPRDPTAPPETEILVQFDGIDQHLGLNKTNYERIRTLYGNESNNWINQPVTLTVENVEAFGKIQPGVRVVMPQPQAQAGQMPPPGAQQQAPAPTPQAPPAPTQQPVQGQQVQQPPAPPPGVPQGYTGTPPAGSTAPVQQQAAPGPGGPMPGAPAPAGPNTIPIGDEGMDDDIPF